MAIIPEEKRQQITDLLGEELTQELEAGLLARGEKAIADGVEHKEESEVEEAVTEDTEEEEVVEETSTDETVEQVAEAEGEVSDSTDETGDAEDGAVEKGDDRDIAASLAAIVEAVQATRADTIDAVKTLTERIEQIEASVENLNDLDEAKVAKLAAETPDASLEAMVKDMLSKNSRSVIGMKETMVHGNSGLSKEKPEETEFDEKETEGSYAGLFFNKWRGT